AWSVVACSCGSAGWWFSWVDEALAVLLPVVSESRDGEGRARRGLWLVVATAAGRGFDDLWSRCRWSTDAVLSPTGDGS
ncbi:hypothetical protein Dimus_015537, partial [Dionaea muscipula]